MIEQRIKRSSPIENHLGQQNPENEPDSSKKPSALISRTTVFKASSGRDTSVMAQYFHDKSVSTRVTDAATRTQFTRINTL